MDLEQIKSPLPARNVTISTPEPEPIKNEAEPVADRLNLQSNEVKPETSVPVKKKPKWLLLGGIGGGIIVLGLLGVLLLPKLMGSKTQAVTLTYWGLWEDETIMRSVIEDFEAKNPGIKVNYRQTSKIDYRSRLQGRLTKDDSTDEVPDIFRIHSTWLPNFENDLAPVPETTVASLGMNSDFYDVYKQDLQVNGQYKAIPLMYDGLALFYNKNLIENGNVSLPRSWWDLEQAANKLTVKDSNGKIIVSGAALGITDNVDHWSDIIGLMIKQSDVNVFKNDQENMTKLQSVLKYYSLFYTKYKIWDESLPSSTEFFANGKLAFYFAPSWRAHDIDTLKSSDLKYGITTVPQLPTLTNAPADQISDAANLTNIFWANYWVEGVNVKSKKQKEAWKFLEYLASKEGLEKLYAAESATRAFGEIYPRKSMAGEISSNELLKPFLVAAENSKSWYLASATHDNGINDEMAKYFKDAINGVTTDNEVATAMTNLANGINQIRQKYQLTKY